MDTKRIIKQVRHYAWVIVKNIVIILFKAVFDYISSESEEPRCHSLVSFSVAELDSQLHAGTIDHYTYKARMKVLNARPLPY